MIDALLMIGRTRGFEEVTARALAVAESARLVPDIPAALECGSTPNLAIVLQHWPDEYPFSEVRGLLAAFPLARLMVVQGPWCLSEGRTRQHWPPATRVSCEEALPRLERELEVLAGTRPPLPWTAGRDEIFAFDYGT